MTTKPYELRNRGPVIEILAGVHLDYLISDLRHVVLTVSSEV